MGQSLSKRLNFRVNKYPVLLDKDLNPPELNSHGIEKAGFWARLLLRPQKGEMLFWAKNCELTYLSEDHNTISPVVDKEKTDRVIFGTTAYLWYKKNKLSKFGFQVTQSHSVVIAPLFEDISEKIVAAIDSPVSSSSNHKIWEIEGQRMVLDIPVNSRYGYVHLMYQD